MSKDDFYKNSIVLTLSNLSTAVLRFVFSVVLSKELGSEGLGLYSLIMPIYDLFCCLICGGMATALSKETSYYYSKKEQANLMKSVHIAFLFDLLWGLFVTIGFLLLSPVLSKYIVQDARSIYSLFAIAPALLLVSLSSILKGYFYGTSRVKIPSFIDIFEKAVRMIAIIGLMNLITTKSITFTVTITYISLTLGELLSFIMLFSYYKINKKRCSLSKTVITNCKTHSSVQLLSNILVAAIPLCINGLLTTALSSFSTLLIPRRLIEAGINYTEALSMIGKFSGMAITIVFFPSVIILSLSTLLIPDLSKSIAVNDFHGLKRRIEEIFSISLILGLVNLVVCICIPEELGIMFFKTTNLGNYIRTIAFSVPVVYLSSASYSILNGIGKQNKVLINSVLTSVIEVFLLYFLLANPNINIYGYGIAMFVSCLLSLVLNFISIYKFCPIKFKLFNIVISVVLSIVLFNILKILNCSFSFLSFYAKNILIILIGFSMFFIGAFFIQSTD